MNTSFVATSVLRGSENKRNDAGPIEETHIEVSSIITRLMDAVDNFDSKNFVDDLERILCPVKSKSCGEILKLIQDAIVNLNLSKDDEPNLSILPSMCEIDKLAIASHAISRYLALLDEEHRNYIGKWVKNDVCNWIQSMTGFTSWAIIATEDASLGIRQVFRRILRHAFPTYEEKGYEAFVDLQPTVYCQDESVALYLCQEFGLPKKLIRKVEDFTLDDFEEQMKRIEMMLRVDVEDKKKPVLFLTETTSKVHPKFSHLAALSDLCDKFDVYLHSTGDSLAYLILRQLSDPKNERVCRLNGLTVNLANWLNIPSLPVITMYEEKLNISGEVENEIFNMLPIWTTIQCLGSESIARDLKQKFELCCKFQEKVKNDESLTTYSWVGFVTNSNITDDSFKRMVRYFFEDRLCSVIFKFTWKENPQFPSYHAKLNSWLCQVLHRAWPMVYVKKVNVPDIGLALQFSPLEGMSYITDEYWELFCADFDQQLEIMRATVDQKEILRDYLEKSPCLKMAEQPEWAGLAWVRYVPAAWDESMTDRLKNELNRLNGQIVRQLRNSDAAFSLGEGSDGFSYIRFGMVGADTDVTDLLAMVESVARQEENCWNILDSMTEVVKKGIETATLDLQKESENKLWEEGILRHVPVVGSIVNWWSPVGKSWVKGRSLDLTAGVIESTENIYKFHSQGRTKATTESVVAKTTNDDQVGREMESEGNGET